MKKGMLITTILLVILTACKLTTAAVENEVNSERDALMALYNSTNGPGWWNNTNWGGTDPCDPEWFGVTCDSSGYVTGIDLHSNDLSGPIPPELGNLSNLVELLLTRNRKLSGSIPPELGNLSNLSYLRLSYNQLSGSIPPELGNLSGVRYFYLYDNQLSGPIPPELGNLSNLVELLLNNNQLNGSIPPEFGNLSGVHYL